MNESSDGAKTPHAFEHRADYATLRTTGPGVLGGNDELDSLSHQQALALQYADWLTTETPLSQRQAQAWVLRRHADASRQTIATILGVTPPSVDEYLDKADQKVAEAVRLATIFEFAETRYFDYPSDGRPTQPILVAEETWTGEIEPDTPSDPLVRHHVTYRWYADTRDGGAYHIETVDRIKTDEMTGRDVTTRQYGTLRDAVQGFYTDSTPPTLREAVVRWTLVRDVCCSQQVADVAITVPSPVTLVDAAVDVGRLLDFVDEGLITVAEAEAFVDSETTTPTDSVPIE